jgi:23S rRNA (adenine-N6)-dimethyltransferase
MSKRKKQGGNPPLWVSQNFLTSKKTIQKLIHLANINANDHVVEIGPGKGHITGILVQYAQKVSAIEIDRKMYERLYVKFGGVNNLRLYHFDFLKWSLPPMDEYKIFANIPFCHTTDILRKLTKSKNPPQEAWLIMEKGAAKRFMGLPSENLGSLMLKPVFDLRIAYYFRREDFHPMPGVDVVMVHLKRKPFCDILPMQLQAYHKFIENSLSNNGAGLFRLFTKRQLSMACKMAKINDIASGDILYIQWLCLFRCYYDHVWKTK